MKAITTLGGLLLLVPLMWICSGQEPVLVECNYFNFRAIVKRALFYSDELVSPDELFLGTGCQAIHVRPDELEFDYPISLCGIVLQVFCDRTVFQSWLTYTPRNGLVSAELHLECIVPSQHLFMEPIIIQFKDLTIHPFIFEFGKFGHSTATRSNPVLYDLQFLYACRF